jgi:hypothetical protein
MMMLGEAIPTITTPYLEKLVSTVVHFTAPPVLFLMVLVHLLGKKDGLQIQVTNAVEGTLSSPSCKNP